MELLLTILTLLHLSHALHAQRRTEVTTTQILKRQGMTPWWKLPNTDNGESYALTGQQYGPFDDYDDSTSSSSNTYGASTPADTRVCTINQCQNSGVLNKQYCGEHARCLNNRCQCNLGWKPDEYTQVARGWIGLEALTVWIDANTAGCTERCDSLSCSEVPQKKGCFDGGVKHEDNVGQGQGFQGGLATDSLHLGAVKAPGADAGIGG